MPEDHRDAAFGREGEAFELVQSIADPTERLLVDAALRHACTALATDRPYWKQVTSGGTPFDLVFFVTAARSFLRRKRLLSLILSGGVRTLEETNQFDPENNSELLYGDIEREIVSDEELVAIQERGDAGPDLPRLLAEIQRLRARLAARK